MPVIILPLKGNNRRPINTMYKRIWRSMPLPAIHQNLSIGLFLISVWVSESFCYILTGILPNSHFGKRLGARDTIILGYLLLDVLGF